MSQPNVEPIDVDTMLDEDIVEFPLVDDLIEGFLISRLSTISEEEEDELSDNEIEELSDETGDEEVFEISDNDDYEITEDDSEDSGAEGAEQLCCICQGVKCGELIRCNNPYCKFEWFHLNCVGLEEAPSEGVWYCPNHLQESSRAD